MTVCTYKITEVLGVFFCVVKKFLIARNTSRIPKYKRFNASSIYMVQKGTQTVLINRINKCASICQADRVYHVSHIGT